VRLKVKSIKSVFWISITKGLSQSASWIVTILLARLLVPADFGLVAIAMIFIAFIEMMNDLGIGVALIQKQNLNENEINTAFITSILLGIFFTVILFTFSGFISRFFNNAELTGIIQAASFGVLLVSIRNVPINLLHRELDFKTISFATVSSNIISGISSIILAYSGYKVWSLIIGFLIRESIMTAVITIAKPIKLKKAFDRRTMVKLTNFGLPVSGSRIIWYFTQNFDYLLVGKILGESILGLYRVAFVIGRTPLKKIWLIVNRILVPVFSRLVDDKERLTSYFLRVNRYLALIIVPANIGLFLLANDFILVILKEKWIEILVPLKVFLLLSIVESLSLACAPLLVAKGMPKINFKISLLGSLLFIPALLIGIKFKLIGILVVWAVYLPLMTCIKISVVLKKLDLPFLTYLNNLRDVFTSTFIMVLGILLADKLYLSEITSSYRLFLSVVLGVMIYFFTIYIWPGKLKVEINDILTNLINTKSKRKSKLANA